MSHAEATFPVEAESIQDRSAWGRGVLASYEDVTPSADTSRRRSGDTDAARLTFSLQLLLIIVGSVLAGAGSYWAGQRQNTAEFAAVRSDVRDIKTSIEGVTKQQTIEIEQLRRDYEALKSEQALQRVRFEEARNTIAEIRGFMSAMKGAPR